MCGDTVPSLSALAQHTLLEEKELTAVLQSLVDCKLLEPTTEALVGRVRGGRVGR